MGIFDLTDSDRINDVDGRIRERIGDLATRYAESLHRSGEENEERGEIREEIVDLGLESRAFQHGVTLIKTMSPGEQRAYIHTLNLVVEALQPKQQEMFPEEFERIKKREEARAQTVADAIDSDTNPRSDPNAGGAKPQIPVENPEGEQAEGEDALAALAPKTAAAKKKSQSQISAEALAAAKLN